MRPLRETRTDVPHGDNKDGSIPEAASASGQRLGGAGYGWIKPSVTAIATACAPFVASSLWQIDCMCAATVRFVIPSDSAI
jgi:hypothetical protein